RGAGLAVAQARSNQDVRGITESRRYHRETARRDRGRCDQGSGALCGASAAEPRQDAPRRERVAGRVREERRVAANVRRQAGYGALLVSDDLGDRIWRVSYAQ